MTPADSSVAEASVPTTTHPTLNSSTSLHPQDAGEGADRVSSSELAQETQEDTQRPTSRHGYIQTVATDTDQSVAVSDSVNIHKTRTSHPRAAAATANIIMTQQAKEEDAPLGVVMANALGGLKTSKPARLDTVPSMDTFRRRPSRAAAAVANAGMARQAKEEEGTLGMLISAVLVDPVEQNTKKRTTEMKATPAAKRSKVTKQKSLEMEQPRGKKRRQAAVYEAASVMEASPIITDLPPLPFTTTSPELKGKKVKTLKMKRVNQVKEVEGDSTRSCEFCKKVTNICVQMHCHACRRVYHAGCFLHAFKPYVEEKKPILDQMERLQLEVPDRRGNIFRCASCKAAFIDFYESGGYLWDCDCPTCTQPEKLIYYRQRMLVQMMNDMELEKQRSKEKKGQKKNSTSSTNVKPSIPTPSRSNSSSRSRRTRGRSATPDDQVMRTQDERQELKKEHDAGMAEITYGVNQGARESNPGLTYMKEETAEPMDVDENGTTKAEDGQNMELHRLVNDEKLKHLKTREQHAKRKPVAQLNNEPTTPQNQQEVTSDIKYEPVGEPEQPDLSGNELVNAVRVHREGKGDGYFFTVMCSQTSSLRASGIMKTGICTWFPKKTPVIKCECCYKSFNYSEFVHHTDSNLIKDVKCASEDPMPFLFVEHRDNTHHTLLDKFLPALRAWAKQQSANNTPTKSRRSQAVNQDAPVAVVTSAATMTNTKAAPETLHCALTRLQTLALFKRPKHRSDKTSTVALLSDPASLVFVAQVVCISPKYVMNMQNGSLVDRVVGSKTPVPGDSFPRKAGWLAFNRKPFATRHITCVCCEKSFSFDEFVGHAGISLNDLKARELLYVVERLDESALVPFKTFLRDLEVVKSHEVDQFLDQLHPPPPSPPRL